MAGALNSRPEEQARDNEVRAVSDEQPNAPYLEAVVAYAFRGTARYHVPGHKGGPGADPGLRKAIGVDALAAVVVPHERRHPGQPRPVPGARAARGGDRRPAQLAHVADRRPRPERRAPGL